MHKKLHMHTLRKGYRGINIFYRWDLAEGGWDLAESGWDLAEWLERLAANATVLGSIPASSDTVESEGRQMKQCWIQYIEKKLEKSPCSIAHLMGCYCCKICLEKRTTNPLTTKRWKVPNDFVKIPVHLFSVRFLKFLGGCIHPCCSCLDLGCLVTHLPPQSHQSQHHSWKTQS
jgi:hypothetical protein